MIIEGLLGYCPGGPYNKDRSVLGPLPVIAKADPFQDRAALQQTLANANI